MADRQIKIVGKHTPNCAGVRLTKKGDWPWPWGPIAWGDHGEPTVKTWRHYGKSGKVLRTWVVFVCNDTQCKAQLHVEQNFILSACVDRRSDHG